LPVIDWAHGAPAGETKPSAHGDVLTNDQGHGGNEAPAGDAHGQHAPGSATETPAHADDHGTAHAHPHAQHDDGDHADQAHAARDAHGHGHDAHTSEPGSNHAAFPWKDPIVLVGITGVVSLLAAAVLAMKKR
jgi:hypothetical protein